MTIVHIEALARSAHDVSLVKTCLITQISFHSRPRLLSWSGLLMKAIEVDIEIGFKFCKIRFLLT